MKNYCLNVEEIYKLLKWRESGEPVDCKELLLIIEDAESWTTRIICIALFFARILEREKPNINTQKNMINILFKMEEELFFEVQGGDDEFVDFLLRHLRNPDESLEASIIELQNRLSEYSYEKALRY